MTGLEHAGRLWALALLAIPILIHLLARRTAPPVDFPPAALLDDAAAGAARRRRLRRLLQLALRLAAVAALAAAFARPMLRTPVAGATAAGPAQTALVLVLDDSLSASRPADPAKPEGSTRLGLGIARARAVLASLGAECEAAAVFASGRSLGPMAPANLSDALGKAWAGAGGDMAGALAAVPAFLDAMEPLQPAVLVLSDCEEGALDADALAALRRHAPVAVVDVGAAGTGGDWALLDAAVDRQRLAPGEGAVLNVRVSRSPGEGGQQTRRMELVLNGTACAWTDAALEPGQEAGIQLNFTSTAGMQSGEVRLAGIDSWAENDRLPVALVVPPPVRAAVVCAQERLDDSGRALRLALSAGPGSERKAFLAELKIPAALAEAKLDAFDVFVLSGPPAADAALWRALAARVGEGAGMVVLAEDAAALDAVAVPLGLPVPAASGEVALRGGAKLVPSAAGRELLQPFAAAAGAPVFSKALRLDGPAEDVLAWLRGDGVECPGIVEWDAGRGLVLVLASGVGRGWSRLAEPDSAALFVPLLHELTARAAGRAPAVCRAETGADVRIGVAPRERTARFWLDSGTVRSPQGVPTPDGQLFLRLPAEPGAYRLVGEADGVMVSERALAVSRGPGELAGRRGAVPDGTVAAGTDMTDALADLTSTPQGRDVAQFVAGLCLLLLAAELLVGSSKPVPRTPQPPAGGETRRGRASAGVPA